jgi:chondroitin 4-sulfotransferase 11
MFGHKKLLFIHIPKTAGTSIVFSLFKKSKVEHNLLSKYSEDFLRDVFVFCVIRNPFDRFISQWLYHTNYKDNFFYKKYNKKFDVFSYLDIVKNNSHRVTWKSMSRFIFHKTKKVDFFLRFENLSNDWKKLCNILGLDIKLEFLKKNTNKNHYSFYYNDYLISEIEKIYKEDIINFNYKFEKL